MVSVNDGRLMVRVEERLHLERYPLVLQWLDGLGVDDGGTIKGQFDGLGVGDMRYFHRVREAFRVSVEQAIHVLPNGDFLGIKAVGKNGRSEVGAFATKGDAVLAVGSATNEALREAHEATNMIVVQFADSQSRFVPIGIGGAEVGFVFSDDIFSGIQPARGDVALAEVFLDDAGRDKFAVANGLVVLVVVGGVGLLQFLPKFDEKPGDVFGKIGVGILDKKPVDDAVVIGDNFMQGLHAQISVMFTKIGQCLFEHVGRLAHSRDHEQNVLVLILAHNLRQITHGIGPRAGLNQRGDTRRSQMFGG